MNEDLDKAIQELIEAGVSDDEIKKFIRDYSPVEKDNGIGVLGHIGGQFWKGVGTTAGSTLRGLGNMAYRVQAPIEELITGQPALPIDVAATLPSPNITPASIYAAGNAIEQGLESTGITRTNPELEKKEG